LGAIAVDEQDRIYVADRIAPSCLCGRKLLANWKQFRKPSGVWVDNMIYVADSQAATAAVWGKELKK